MDMVSRIEFGQFWLAYPRKVGKGAAIKAFVSARKKAPMQTIMDGLSRLKFDDVKFCPHPTTWLNQERWADEESTPQKCAQAVAVEAAVAETVAQEAAELWRNASARLAAHDAARYRSWLAPLVLLRENRGVLTFGAPSRFHADWVQRHYEQDLRLATGKVIAVVSAKEYNENSKAKAPGDGVPGGPERTSGAVCGGSPSAHLTR